MENSETMEYNSDSTLRQHSACVIMVLETRYDLFYNIVGEFIESIHFNFYNNC